MAAAVPVQEKISREEDVFRVLKADDVKHIVYVPDAWHSTAIRLAEADNEINFRCSYHGGGRHRVSRPEHGLVANAARCSCNPAEQVTASTP